MYYLTCFVKSKV